MIRKGQIDLFNILDTFTMHTAHFEILLRRSISNYDDQHWCINQEFAVINSQIQSRTYNFRIVLRISNSHLFALIHFKNFSRVFYSSSKFSKALIRILKNSKGISSRLNVKRLLKIRKNLFFSFFFLEKMKVQ